MEKVLSGATVPVKVLPLTVKVTVSPTLASPPTTPVTGMFWPASAILMMSSLVILASSVMEGAGGVFGAVSGGAVGVVGVFGVVSGGIVEFSIKPDATVVNEML